MIEKERIRALNEGTVGRGDYVLYWMQASQRAEYNHALEYAVARGNELGLPVVVFFGLTGSFPEANLRHYQFMIEGLAEVREALAERGILLVVRRAAPADGAVEMSRRAALVVCDRGYLGIQRAWRASAAGRIRRPLIQVESDVVIPVEEASGKEEYAAATIRPKIRSRLEEYLRPMRRSTVRRSSLRMEFDAFDITDPEAALASLRTKQSPGPSQAYRGGFSEAKRRLDSFIRSGLDHFDEMRNDPGVDRLSHMSPYLHFGQISPLYIALRVSRSGSPGADAYLEELVVRRELSMNFVFYNDRYDSFEGLPEWCRKTLKAHAGDEREYIYTEKELERYRTHDPYWNAAQEEMVLTGTMHGYMRMYWGKKIIEWSRTPEEAFSTALRLNNRYELDGRDPNGFAGVAWCFGKHDRPWGERPVFGMVRYMNDRGLRRKFDIDRYVRRVAALRGDDTGSA
ncbi:MAG TPA: deoxyribodipyrimidine photolyase [Candidatus Eisenbacteria bacterium]|uniref:Deoxyribodipyrimidine photo-lyase n=1 Tax=Eiseniibacteriota bacterium TaxID=2212470 RepID=A0A7V2AVK8_UNCEI|nr:deoxyribodipyrimidine photolyase [Candidatus Eisenbacteria bacterium]